MESNGDELGRFSMLNHCQSALDKDDINMSGDVLVHVHIIYVLHVLCLCLCMHALVYVSMLHVHMYIPIVLR